MKKGLILGVVASMLIFGACEKTDTKSYLPTWKGFSYTPQPVHRGDTLTVKAVQANIGHLIYHAEYTWTVTGEVFKAGSQETETWDSTFTKKVTYDNQPQDPQISFKVPENLATGTLSKVSITFKGDYDYSGQGEFIADGSQYHDPEYIGYIQQQQSTTINGKCGGSVTISVSN